MKPVAQKTKPFRSARYLKWVRSLPCSVCGTDLAIQAHHLIGHGTKGGSIKSDDRLTMPLCHAHHHELHHYGNQRFDSRYSTMRTDGQLYYVNLTLGRARVHNALRANLIDDARELLG